MNTQSVSNTLRAQFPALAADSSRPVYYFDNAATAYMPASVRQAICDFYDRAHGNVHRAVYSTAEHTTSMHERVRIKVQHFLSAASHKEIIFTGGATDSLNAVAHMWAYHHLNPGDGIVITQAEHHAHYVLWHEVAKRTGAVVHVLPINPRTYTVDLSDLAQIMSQPVKLVAVSAYSNVLGPIWGAGDELLTQLIGVARKVKACIVIDAAQTVAHQKVDVQKLDCDFLAFSAHKMGGPTGLGVLYAREALHDAMMPYRFGGGMVAAIAQDCVTWQEAPQRFEAGTPPIAQVVGLGALLDFYRQQVDLSQVAAYEAFLCDQLIAGLEKIAGVQVVGNKQLLAQRGHVVTFYVDSIHAHDLAGSLSEHGVCVRAGDHCAQPLAALWNDRATVRASLFMYNTLDDVMHLIESTKKVVAQWREVL